MSEITLKSLSKGPIHSILEGQGLRWEDDLVFRRWNEDSTICAVAQAIKLAESGRYTLELGFYSPFMAEFGFEMPPQDRPQTFHCIDLRYRIENLGGAKLSAGAEIRNRSDLEAVALEWAGILARQCPPLLAMFMDFEGWRNHYRNKLGAHSRGHGLMWSFLVYAMLADAATCVEEIEAAIAAHAAESSQRKLRNRIDSHLERQRALLELRKSGGGDFRRGHA